MHYIVLQEQNCAACQETLVAGAVPHTLTLILQVNLDTHSRLSQLMIECVQQSVHACTHVYDCNRRHAFIPVSNAYLIVQQI